jgi:hypothetical protein
MQLLMNEVLAAPSSFLDFASLRQAVRLACFAAASPEAWVPAAALAAGGRAGRRA